MAKKETKGSPFDGLPDRIKEFPWAKHHFYKGKSYQGKKPKMSLNKNFIVEAMRFFNLNYRITDYKIIPLPNKKEPIVAMKVAVWQKEDTALGKEGFSTVGDKSYEDGQSHFGQQALNRALANAVERWLQISDNDVEIIVATKNLEKGIQEVEDITAPEPTPIEEAQIPVGSIKDMNF
jgi:hypothetical protein